MSFGSIANTYLNALRNEFEAARRSGEATPELSFRGSLDNFFKQLAEYINSNIAVIPEPKNQGKAGRPDWRFHHTETMGVYGYVEAKGLDTEQNIDVSIYLSQIEKYLSLGHRVILTDGVDFVLFMPNAEEHLVVSVTSKPIDWQTLNINGEVESLFRQFFHEPGYRRVSEEQLIEDVAKRAKLLSGAIKEMVELSPDEAASESEEKTIRSLKNLKQIVETQHDSTLQSSTLFSDFVAQVLSFGLLYAHRVVRGEGDNPKDRYQKIHDFWSSILHQDYASRLSPFRELIHQLNDELDSSLSHLGTWYDDTRRLLAYVELSDQQRSNPDYHTLYERFLAIYDPETRFDYGAFYTPPALSAYTVSLTEAVAEIRFGNNALYSAETKIIDPCCGTGTFLEELLERYTDGQNPATIGFEILPAPYALAHYRMTMIGNGKYPSNLQIILTNTLSDALEQDVSEQTEGDETLIQAEQKRARQLCEPPLTVVIGNPPSSDSGVSSSHEGRKIRELLEDFRPPEVNRTQRQNTQKPAPRVRQRLQRLIGISHHVDPHISRRHWITAELRQPVPQHIGVKSLVIQHPVHQLRLRRRMVGNLQQIARVNGPRRHHLNTCRLPPVDNSPQGSNVSAR